MDEQLEISDAGRGAGSTAYDAQMLRPSSAALEYAEPKVFWLDDVVAPEPAPTLVQDTTADLVIVGAGYTGLWTALIAKEADPSRDVVLVEAHTAGSAASGRNGGFCSASLTHGDANGLDRFPEEFDTLQRLGMQNLDDIEATLIRHQIDAEFERTGELDIAIEPWQLRELQQMAQEVDARGGTLDVLDAEQTRAIVDSPRYLGSVYDRDGVAMVHPAKLALGLRRACLDLGVRLYEHTPVTGVRKDKDGSGLSIRTELAAIRADRVVLATNADTSLLRRLRQFVVPVYDYVLVTEPLSEEQMNSLGWQGRQGLSDTANQFHYYRLTADNRILWGGYDVIYHYGSHVRAEYDQRPETFALLAEQFFDTFPQLAGVRFTHRWGGAIDTCSRFTAFWGTAFGGRLSYVAGFTGLGVGASRFGGLVALDLVDGVDNERTRLQFVRSKPLPFPPEPLRYTGIQLTRRAIAHADAHEGRRNLWLRTLDRLGLGFDS